MFLDEDRIGKKPKARESRAMFMIAMTALVACIVMVVGLMSPPAVAVDAIKTSGITKTAPQTLPTQK
jgi:cell division septal protein FtsQ